jgi:hypothetical protein
MPELPVCRKCGAQFIAPVKFCELCGTPVLSPQMPEPAAEPPAPEPEPEPEHVPENAQEPEPAPVPEPKVQKPARAPVAGPPVDELTMTPDIPVILEKGSSPGPAKPLMNKALILGGVIILLILIAGVYFVGLPMIKGGVAAPAPAPVTTLPATMPPMPASTPAPTPKATAVPTPDNTFVPQPTQVMPKNQEVFFNVQKDQVNADITVLFQRGPGENLISSAEVKVTHPDGTVLTGTLKPSQGKTELVLKGSKGTDRVEVIAKMYNGQSYRLKDELIPFKGHS